MPYLIYVPDHPKPFHLSDRDSNYIRYFNLWGWRIEMVDPGTPGLPKTPATPGESMLQTFESSELYGIWKEGVRIRSQEDREAAANLRALVEEKKKREGKEGGGGEALV